MHDGQQRGWKTHFLSKFLEFSLTLKGKLVNLLEELLQIANSRRGRGRGT